MLTPGLLRQVPPSMTWLLLCWRAVGRREKGHRGVGTLNIEFIFYCVLDFIYNTQTEEIKDEQSHRTMAYLQLDACVSSVHP